MPASGRALAVGVVLLAGHPGLASESRLSPCIEAIHRDYTSLAGYECLIAQEGPGEREAVKGVLRSVLRAHPEDARALLYLGLVREYAGEPVEEEVFIRAERGFRHESNARGLIWALATRIGKRCLDRGQCDDTVGAMLEETERLAETSGDVQLRRAAQVWWMRSSEKRDDIGAFARAVERLSVLPGEEAAPSWLKTLQFTVQAHVAGVLGAHDRKFTLYSQLARDAEPGTALAALALGGEASAATHLALQGSFDRGAAEALLREALRQEEQTGQSISLFDPAAGALPTRAHLALLLGSTDEAMEVLERTVREYQARLSWSYPFYAYWLQARYASERDPRSSVASSAVDAALRASRGPGLEWEYAHSLLMRAYVLWRSGQAHQARDDAFTALELLEGLRQKQADLPIRLRYDDSLAFAYHLVAAALLNGELGPVGPGELEQAFQIIERLRARGLLSAIVERASGGPENRLRAVELGVERVHRSLLEPDRPLPERLAAIAELREGERRLEALRKELASRPSSRVPAPSLSELQSVLRPKEALVSFVLWQQEPTVERPYAQGTSWALIVTRDRAQAVRLDRVEEARPSVGLWLSMLDRRNGSDEVGGIRLGEAFFGPVLAALPREVEELVVIPDGVLHELPIDALRAADGHFLAERFQIATVGSAALLLHLRTIAPPIAPWLVALASPELSPAARERFETALGNGHPSALPHSIEEGRLALAAFSGQGEVYSGREATESVLSRPGARQPSLIHLASHALLDMLRPEHSGLLLAGEAGRDGVLDIDEIVQLRLTGPVVVLASCRSSAGPVHRAEGTMSLARAFLHAGARSVVGNLRPVRDEESLAFFRVFYHHVAEGLGVGAALTQAKRDGIERGHPAASWAGYVVHGDAAAVPLPRPVPAPSLLWLAGILCTVAGCWLALVVSRRRSTSRPG